MDIRIRTHEELRSDRVTIEISGTGDEVRDVRLYTDEQVADLQASEAELVAEPLRREIQAVRAERQMARNRTAILERRVETFQEALNSLVTERDQAQIRAEKLIADQMATIQRAETAEAQLRDEGEMRERLSADLSRMLRRAEDSEDRAELADRNLRDLINKHSARLTERDAETEARANDLEVKLERMTRRAEEAEAQAREWDADRHNERNRADARKHRIAQLERNLAQAIDREAKLEAKIEEAQKILHDPDVVAARETLVGRQGVRLANAVVNAINTLA